MRIIYFTSCILGKPKVSFQYGREKLSLTGFTLQELAGDWLVLQLQPLIDIAFRMTTGNVETLRSSGLQLLKVQNASVLWLVLLMKPHTGKSSLLTQLALAGCGTTYLISSFCASVLSFVFLSCQGTRNLSTHCCLHLQKILFK